jgi:hypothetical protein
VRRVRASKSIIRHISRIGSDQPGHGLIISQDHGHMKPLLRAISGCPAISLLITSMRFVNLGQPSKLLFAGGHQLRVGQCKFAGVKSRLCKLFKTWVVSFNTSNRPHICGAIGL